MEGQPRVDTAAFLTVCPCQIAERDVDSTARHEICDCHLIQYVEDILFVSNEYGTNSSISYTAINLTGRPKNYPVAGDHLDSFILPTFGSWWRDMPSYAPEFGCRNIVAAENPPIDDFVVVRFERSVYPRFIKIFETMNKGAVARIWAYGHSGQWRLLYNGYTEYARPSGATDNPQQVSRIFEPKLRPINEQTRVLRIEFCTRYLTYAVGFDGIMMIGTPNPGPLFNVIKPREQRLPPVGHADPVERTTAPETIRASCMVITELPYELLFNIFSHLDLVSLQTTEKVCQTFREVVRDSHLYGEVNLRPYYMLANTHMLNWLQSRCGRLRKLDLSWCGMFDYITDDDLKRFLKRCGAGLTHLRLNSVPFSSAALNYIPVYCHRLTELCIQNGALNQLQGLEHLVRLDISRTAIETNSLLPLLARNGALQYLNVSCCENVHIQDVAIVLAEHNRELISLVAWRTRALQATGLVALKACSKLQEVDISWTMSDESLDGALAQLLPHCPGLRKLFLGGIRSVQDSDVLGIARHAANLEQLDLLGCISVTGESVQAVFEQCPKLRYIDISYCPAISAGLLAMWKEFYPSVSIIVA